MPEAKQKNLQFFLNSITQNENPIINTDSHKLYGVLTNLIKNAIKYTNEGEINFGYSIKNNIIEFFVRDTGIGVPKERQKAIFNRFEQADIEDNRVFEGSGLGLAISKAYVEMLGGDISVESTGEKGSTFKFNLPYTNKVQDEIMKVQKHLPNTNVNIEDLNLLIVEDDDISSEFLTSILNNHFKKISLAKNGLEAIDYCKNNSQIDLVLMDIKMPKLGGYEATREIRKFNKDLPIIAQTAYAMSGDREKAIAAGCTDYISKPIDKTLLLEMITKLMSAR